MNPGPILLIEDNPADQALAQRALKQHRFENPLVIARDGVEALDYLFAGDQHAAPDSRAMPALILLDLKLPRLTGIEVLRRLRADERTKLVPVIILTSSAEEQDVLEGYRSGANSYICKPLDFNQFSDAIRELGSYWLRLNQPPPREGDF